MASVGSLGRVPFRPLPPEAIELARAALHASSPPRRIVRPGLALSSVERRVLVVSHRHASLARKLEAHGATVRMTADHAEATEALAAQTFHAVAVDPLLDGVFAWIRELKIDPRRSGMAAMALAKVQNELTPLFVLPLEGEREFAVILHAPDAAYLDAGEWLPLAEMILFLDRQWLLRWARNVDPYSSASFSPRK